jgi:hypothetical protein
VEAENPHVGPIVDLVDPYLDYSKKGATGGQLKGLGSANVCWWLDTHPGRWALVGVDGVGLSKHVMGDLGYRTGLRSVRTSETSVQMHCYASLYHPDGEGLTQALRRSPIRVVLDLPELTRDEFNWTPAELAEAAWVMRQNLFPSSEKRKRTVEP